MRDAILNFGTINFATTALSAAGALAFADVVDLASTGRDLGVGAPLCLEFHVETDWTISGGSGLAVMFFAAFMTSDPGTSVALTTQVLTGTVKELVTTAKIGNNTAGAYHIGQPKAGLKVYAAIPPFPTYDLTAAADSMRATPLRYLGCAVWAWAGLSGGVTAGTVSARLVEWAGAWKPYAVGADLH